MYRTHKYGPIGPIHTSLVHISTAPSGSIQTRAQHRTRLSIWPLSTANTRYTRHMVSKNTFPQIHSLTTWAFHSCAHTSPHTGSISLKISLQNYYSNCHLRVYLSLRPFMNMVATPFEIEDQIPTIQTNRTELVIWTFKLAPFLKWPA
jgi:hypothetical protein